MNTSRLVTMVGTLLICLVLVGAAMAADNPHRSLRPVLIREIEFDSAGSTGAFWNPLTEKDSIPFFWPSIVYDQGLWVFGKVDNEVELAYIKWFSNFSRSPC